MTAAKSAAWGRMRYVAINAAVWAVVCLAGVGVIAALGRMGRAQVQSAEVRAAIADSVQRFRQGETFPPQQALERILRDRPAARGEIIEAAGVDLLAMPRVFQATVAAPSGAGADPLDGPRRLMLLGDVDGADAALAALEAEDALPRAGSLWRARIALDRGEVNDAKERFDTYWRGHSAERRAALSAFAPEGALTDDAVQALLWLGLWDECFSRVGDAPQSPMAMTAQGLQYELDGRTADALAAYGAALAAQPSHVLAGLRAKALTTP